jgi:hypothetical protein
MNQRDLPRTAPLAAQERMYAQAAALFHAGQYAAAFGRVAPLADAGHLPSAELALLMVKHGKALFGAEWSATPAQLMRWKVTVLNGLRSALPVLDHPAGD